MDNNNIVIKKDGELQATGLLQDDGSIKWRGENDEKPVLSDSTKGFGTKPVLKVSGNTSGKDRFYAIALSNLATNGNMSELIFFHQ